MLKTLLTTSFELVLEVSVLQALLEKFFEVIQESFSARSMVENF